MNGFWADGPAKFREAMQHRIEELRREMNSLAELRNLTEDSVEKNRLELEIGEKYCEYAALLSEIDGSLY